LEGKNHGELETTLFTACLSTQSKDVGSLMLIRD
jgi:hypothetical protein